MIFPIKVENLHIFSPYYHNISVQLKKHQHVKNH